MLSAIVEDFARIPGVEVWTLLEPGALPDIGHLCRRTSAVEEPAHFRQLAGRADSTLVIAPEFDRVLLKRSRWVVAAGGRLLGSLPPAVRLAGDKWALAKHWHAQGVPTPRTLPMVPGSLPLPVVCKPRRGAGSQATFLVRTPEEWAAIEPRDMIMQPYIEGSPASVALLRGPGSCVALCPTAQYLSADGRFQYLGGSLPLPADLAERATRLALAAVAHIPGLQGYVGVDLILGPTDVAIEINPRLTTSYIGLRRLCRDNLAEIWLRGLSVTPTWHDGHVTFGADGIVSTTSPKR